MVAKFVQPDYTDNSQSGSLYPTYIDAAIAVLARHGRWFAAHEQDQGSPAPELSVRLDAGYDLSGNEIAAQSVGGFTIPSAGQHRIDRVVLNPASGVAYRLAGTAVTGSPSATPPAIPAGLEPICQVLITSADTVITNSMITDERRFPVAQKRGIAAVARNLSARTGNIGSPTNPLSDITVTADELEVQDSNGNVVRLTDVAVSAVLSNAGANGLDTGAEASSTWYYGWVIWNPATQTVAALLSTSASAPTMPSGYTHKALVTAVYNNGSSNLVPFQQKSFTAWFESPVAVLSGGSASTETAISLTTAVPTAALSFLATINAMFTASGGGNFATSVSLRVVTGLNALNLSSAAPTSAQDTCGAQCVLPNLNRTLFYIFGPTTNVAAASIDVFIAGFVLPGGGQ